MSPSALDVGDETRAAAGRAILASLALISAFAVMTWLTKETRSLDVRQPWQDDPYDVLVSLDFVALPVLVAAGALRVQLCRRYSPLPARRLVDLLRICLAGIAACLVTALGEWVAVGLRLHHAQWNAVTAWQIAALLIWTVALLAGGRVLLRAGQAVRHVASAEAQPDWLTDAVGLGLVASGTLRGRSGQGRDLVHWADAHIVAWVRRHPVRAAAALASLLALPYVAAKVLLEGYPPMLVLLSFFLPAAAFFALIVLVGRYLRIVAPRPESPPVGVAAAVAACVAGTVSFALHDSLLPNHQTAIELNALLFGGAAAGGVAFLLARLALRGGHLGE